MPDRCIEVWKRFRRASGSSPSLKFTNAKYILPNAEILDISRARPPNSAMHDTTGDTSPTALIEYHIAKIQYNDQAPAAAHILIHSTSLATLSNSSFESPIGLLMLATVPTLTSLSDAGIET